ncbi:MAG: DNA topoisomerase IB [Candidatus Elarobacter sp.]
MLPTEGPEAAKAAGLRYTTDMIPGIRRVKRRKGFTFVADGGEPIRDPKQIARIESLAIPPAYTDVWICPIANGHLQATGRDARGRKQYRYHKRWRAVRDETKFDRMVAFAKALPAIRAAIARDTAKQGMPREKILATVISLLAATAIRVGNEEYARDNDSYGLTTLQEQHATVRGETIRFHFRGKSGKEHDIAIKDKRLARIVKASQDLPGQNLFEYVGDDGEARPVRSEDVNEYLQEVAGDDFTAKDFRTWEATMICALELATVRVDAHGEAKAAVVEAVKHVAERLGNTLAVCKNCYIHPGMIEEFLAQGTLELTHRAKPNKAQHALSVHEAAVVALVERIVALQSQPLEEVLAKSVAAERSARKKASGPSRGRKRAA